MTNQDPPQSPGDLINHPEEVVYRSCYASIDLKDMLQSAEKRSKIRKLPPAQLFFSLKELDESQVVELLPHITEQQWTTILDLDLWRKDEMNPGRFLAWQRHLLSIEDAVARKILRATDLNAWAFALKSSTQVYARGEDGEFSEEALTFGKYETPDGHFMIALPRNPEKARIYHQLLQKLYQLDPAVTAVLLSSCRYQTSLELVEEAYQSRRRRIEDLGFQDYFDAIEIYSGRDCTEVLPKKKHQPKELSSLPVRVSEKQEGAPLLLFRALATITEEKAAQVLIEELFYICNKLLSADRISPDESAQVKKGILKAINCLNLGLDCWSGGDVGKAADGISNHYLLSFFQIGFGRLTQLRMEAKRSSDEMEPIPGSFLEAALDSMSAPFPELAEQFEGKVRNRFFQTEEDLHWGKKLIEQLSARHR